MGNKALLMAIIVASVVIPMRAARAPSLARGRERTVVHFTLFVAAWLKMAKVPADPWAIASASRWW